MMGERIKVLTVTTLCLSCLLFSLPVFSQTQTPGSLEEVKDLGIKAIKALPGVSAKILKEGWMSWVMICQKVWYWVKYIFQAIFGNLWQQIKGGLEKTWQERKVIIEEGLKEEKQAAQEEIKDYLPSKKTLWQILWDKFKEIISPNKNSGILTPGEALTGFFRALI